MTEIEKLALAVAMLTATVNQLFEQVAQLNHDMQDLNDVFRNCACFGTQDHIEVP